MSETVWTDELLIGMLKEDLGRRNPSAETLSYFQVLIDTAKAEISRIRGIQTPKPVRESFPVPGICPI